MQEDALPREWMKSITVRRLSGCASPNPVPARAGLAGFSAPAIVVELDKERQMVTFHPEGVTPPFSLGSVHQLRLTKTLVPGRLKKALLNYSRCFNLPLLFPQTELGGEQRGPFTSRTGE
jgi:hypothetical protein